MSRYQVAEVKVVSNSTFVFNISGVLITKSEKYQVFSESLFDVIDNKIKECISRDESERVLSAIVYRSS